MPANEQIQQAQGQSERFKEAGSLADLLEKAVKPRTEGARTAVYQGVQTLAEQALASVDLVSDDILKTINSMISELDRRMSEQLNLILHNENFQKLESAWRGLEHLVKNSETDEHLKIRVMPVGKTELAKTLKRYKGAQFDQSPVFKKLYEAEYGQFGGEPYGCIVGDYHFDHSAPDVELLGEMAKIAAATHAPFISGVDPAVLQMESWQDLQNPADLTKIIGTPEHAAWRSLRESEDAKYVGLAMPRFLSRLPYGEKTNPVESIAFEEETGGGDHSKYCWSNAAYAMAANINAAFKDYGWCTQIRGPESGGAVEELPCHTFPTIEGGTDMKCPTEIAITHRRSAELEKNGFMPLVHEKNTDRAVFFGAQSLQKPAKYDDKDAQANAELSARLPYLFASCRFSHYLQKMVYQMVGKQTSRGEIERFLNEWILNYVCENLETANDRQRAERPLAAANVTVEDMEGNPGYYQAKFHIKPHYQLEGMTVSMSLVSKVPAGQS